MGAPSDIRRCPRSFGTSSQAIDLSLGNEAPVWCASHNSTHWIVEMNGEKAHGPILIPREEFPPRLARHLLVNACRRTYFGLCELHDSVKHVTGNNRFHSLREDMQAHMPWCMPVRRFQPHVRSQTMVRLDEVGQAGAQNRLNRIDDMTYVAAVVTQQLLAVFPLATPEEMTGVGKSGLPATVDDTGVPSDVI